MSRIIITDEMLDRIHTDSDIEDLAEELDVDYDELDYAISNKLAEGTACHNCKHVGYPLLHPCNACSRLVTIKDYYEGIEEKIMSKMNEYIEALKRERGSNWILSYGQELTKEELIDIILKFDWAIYETNPYCYAKSIYRNTVGKLEEVYSGVNIYDN